MSKPGTAEDAGSMTSSIDENDILDQVRGSGTSEFEHYVFSVGWLFSATSVPKWACWLIMGMNFLQLLPFVFSINTWDSGLGVFLEVVQYFQLENIIAKGSFAVYLAVFAVATIFALLCLLFVVYLTWNWNDEIFPFQFLITGLRYSVWIIGKCFYISCLGLGISLMDCSHNGAGETYLVLDLFPDFRCWNGPHIALVVFAAFSSLFIIAIGLIAFFAFVSVTTKSNCAMAGPDLLPYLLELPCHTALVLSKAFISSDSVLWPMIQLACFGILLKFYSNDLPCFDVWVNRIQSATYGALLILSFIGLAGRGCLSGGFDDAATRRAVTITGFVLFPFGGLAAALYCERRTRKQNGVRIFREIGVEGTLAMGSIKELQNPRSIEIATRFVYLQESSDEAFIELAENILLTAVTTHTKSVWLTLVYCSFLSDVRNNIPRSEILMRDCKSKSTSIFERYLLFCRERLNRDMARASAQFDALDSTLALNSTFSKATVDLDKFEVLQRSFFKALSAKQVDPETLQKIKKGVAQVRSQLENSMARLLHAYSDSIPVMRLYGRYLCIVKKDAKSGTAFFLEADESESKLHSERLRKSMFDVDLNDIDDAVDRIIAINRFGAIMCVTTRLARMLGYDAANQLLDQNVAAIVPPPHNLNHDRYLQMYQDGNKEAKLVNRERVMAAQHAMGHTFPVKIFVSPISGGSNGAAFVARILPVLDEIPEEILHESPFFATNGDGQIISFNQPFLEKMKCTSLDIYGMNILDFITNSPCANMYDLPETLRANLKILETTIEVNLVFNLAGNLKIRMLICTFASDAVVKTESGRQSPGSQSQSQSPNAAAGAVAFLIPPSENQGDAQHSTFLDSTGKKPTAPRVAAILETDEFETESDLSITQLPPKSQSKQPPKKNPVKIDIEEALTHRPVLPFHVPNVPPAEPVILHLSQLTGATTEDLTKGLDHLAGFVTKTPQGRQKSPPSSKSNTASASPGSISPHPFAATPFLNWAASPGSAPPLQWHQGPDQPFGVMQSLTTPVSRTSKLGSNISSGWGVSGKPPLFIRTNSVTSSSTMASAQPHAPHPNLFIRSNSNASSMTRTPSVTASPAASMKHEPEVEQHHEAKPKQTKPKITMVLHDRSQSRHVMFKSFESLRRTPVSVNLPEFPTLPDNDDADESGEERVASEYGEELRAMKQYAALSLALSSERTRNSLRGGFQYIQLSFFVCLLLHFGWFGGIWKESNLNYSGTNPSGNPFASLSSSHAFQLANLAEIVKFSQEMCFYARIARSGSPLGSNGHNPLVEMVKSATNMRYHMGAVEGYYIADHLSGLPLNVMDVSGAGAAVQQTLSAWQVLHSMATAAITLDARILAQSPPPREWLYIMNNGPTVVFDALQDANQIIIDRMSAVSSEIIAVSAIGLIFEIGMLIAMMVLGLAPMTKRVTMFRSMMMRIYLAVPRSACRKLARRNKKTSNWNEKKSQRQESAANSSSAIEEDGSSYSESHSDDHESQKGSRRGSVSSRRPSINGNSRRPSINGNSRRPSINGNSRRSSLSGSPRRDSVGGTPRRNSVSNSRRGSTASSSPRRESLAFPNSIADPLDLFKKSMGMSRGQGGWKSPTRDSLPLRTSPDDLKKTRLIQNFISRILYKLSSLTKKEEYITIQRGREACKFKIRVRERGLIIICSTLFLLWVAGTYIIFIVTQAQEGAEYEVWSHIYSLRQWDYHLRFLTHELSGGWKMYPNLQEMQSESVLNSINNMALWTSADIDSDLYTLLFDQQCFVSTCASTGLAVFQASGLDALHNYWTRTHVRLAEYLTLRNGSLPGTSTTNLPVGGPFDSNFAIWAGMDQIEYGFQTAIAEHIFDTGAGGVITGLQILFLLLAVFQVVFIDIFLLRRLLSSMMVELDEAANLMSLVPDSVGIVKVCEKERKKTFR